jgi:hypothetical protein
MVVLKMEPGQVHLPNTAGSRLRNMLYSVATRDYNVKIISWLWLNLEFPLHSDIMSMKKIF